jgi:hypothetical protein
MPASSQWTELIAAVRRDLAVAVEQSIAKMLSLSYAELDEEVLRTTVANRFTVVLDGLAERRPPGRSEDESDSIAFGELRARQGVTYSDLLTGWRFGGDALYRLARDVAQPTPERDGLLLDFIELTMAWVDFASLAMATGHRRGELSRARELQHVQTNLVRRILNGTAGASEIVAGLEPLHLDPRASYLAVRARPNAAVGMTAIEGYLGVDGVHGRRRGLTALLDGDLCGFVAATPPRQVAPTVIGISDPAPLTAFTTPFRQATRALETAMAFGVAGTFDFASLAVHAGVLGDPDVGAVLHARYIAPLHDLAGGEAILQTVQRLLANDGSVDATATALGVHANTVRHRLRRFEALTERSLTSHETTVELWWALQARQLIRPERAGFVDSAAEQD